MTGAVQGAFSIRPPITSDLPALVASLRAHARLQGLPDEALTEYALGQALFSPRPLIEALIAVDPSTRESVVGHVLFHDTWDAPYATPGVMVTDVHVRVTRRRAGVGRALIAAVTAAAQTRGATFICWIAMPENAEALSFYRSIGATTRPTIAHALSLED